MIDYKALKEEAAEAPQVVVTRDRTGYRIDGEYYRRVTTLLGGLPKAWMGTWAAKIVAEYAVEHREQWEKLPARDAVKLLKGSPWTKRDDAADRGSAVHAAAEAIAHSRPLPELKNQEETDCAKAVEEFLTRRGAAIMGAEITVFSPSIGYAGTFDLWDFWNEESWVLDWKTSQSVYAEHAVQLAAYRNAEYAIVNVKQTDKEKWTGKAIKWGPHLAERLGVVHVEPTGAKLYPVRYSDRLWTVFRAAAHVKRWQLDTDDYNKTPREAVFEAPLLGEDK